MDPRPNILIVDDRPENLLSLKAMLDDLDVTVHQASSGKEALTLLLHHDIALALLDVQMPEMDGFEMAELMRSSKKTRAIPIIFITAISTDESHIFRGYESGAVDYICKPIREPRILLSKVKVFCDLHIAKRKTEEALAILHTSEAHWQFTFDAIADMVTIHDTNFHILRVNKATADFFKLKPEEMEGKKCFDFFCPMNKQCDHCPALATRESRQSHTVEIQLADHGEKFQVTISPILDENQELIGVIHIAKDISEQRQLESQLRQAQKMEAIGTLAGGIAHDFNNILTPIVGYANLLRRQAKDNSHMQQGLDTIMEAAGRATELVKQILSFSRLQEQVMSPLSIQPIIKEVLKLLHSTLPSTIAVEDDIDMDCGQILADPTQIHQLLMNLCTNSGYAMSEHGGTLKVSLRRISLSADKCQLHPHLLPGPHLCLEVSDTGCGIPQNIQKRIFEPYFTTKIKGKGTGMGLAVVHNIIMSHMGDIQLSSTEGKGSTFRILLPLLKQINIKDTAIEKTLLPVGTEHVLLVDDEESVIKVHREMLISLGYQVSIAKNGEQALKLFRSNPEEFKLLFTDMTMPGLTGAELAHEVLALQPGLPIIICTGFSEHLDAKRAQELGICRFLYKPVTLATMASIIREALDR